MSPNLSCTGQHLERTGTDLKKGRVNGTCTKYLLESTYGAISPTTGCNGTGPVLSPVGSRRLKKKNKDKYYATCVYGLDKNNIVCISSLIDY